MRNAANPIMKKVGTSVFGITCPAQMSVSALRAHRSIIVQNTRSAIVSIIRIETPHVRCWLHKKKTAREA